MSARIENEEQQMTSISRQVVYAAVRIGVLFIGEKQFVIEHNRGEIVSQVEIPQHIHLENIQDLGRRITRAHFAITTDYGS